MNKPFLELKNIKKNFIHKNKTIELFKNVFLNIKKGDLVALIGPSGSGKSSLLHLLSLLDIPTSGQILFSGIDSKKFNQEQKDKFRRDKISIIFQDNNLLADFTAIENVLMPLIIKGEETKKSIENHIIK